ncbi:hypothetical protein FHG87_024584, partial [Trinorchestia longiramus]
MAVSSLASLTTVDTALVQILSSEADWLKLISALANQLRDLQDTQLLLTAVLTQLEADSVLTKALADVVAGYGVVADILVELHTWHGW